MLIRQPTSQANSGEEFPFGRGRYKKLGRVRSRAKVSQLKSCNCNQEILGEGLTGLSKEIPSACLINGGHQELVPEAHDSFRASSERRIVRAKQTAQFAVRQPNEWVPGRVSASLRIGSRLIPLATPCGSSLLNGVIFHRPIELLDT